MNCAIYHCVPVISTEGALLHCRAARLPIPGAGTSVTWLWEMLEKQLSNLKMLLCI